MKIMSNTYDAGDDNVNIVIEGDPRMHDGPRQYTKEINLLAQALLKSLSFMSAKGIPVDSFGLIDGNYPNLESAEIWVKPEYLQEALAMVRLGKKSALAAYAVMTDPKTYID